MLVKDWKKVTEEYSRNVFVSIFSMEERLCLGVDETTVFTDSGED